MLLELRVKDFAIIDELDIVFRPGLNILSGETGSGKTVLIKSLSLLMGTKGSSDIVRTGKDNAVVEGSFDLSSRDDIIKKINDEGIDTQDKLLVVRRVVSSQGKNRVYLNGCLSTLNSLRTIVAPLIELTSQTVPLLELTSQHENRNLLNTAYHLDLVDFYAGNTELRKSFGDKYRRLQQVNEELQELQVNLNNNQVQLEFLRHQADEIENLELKDEGDLNIADEVKKQKAAGVIRNSLDQLEQELYQSDNSVVSKLHSALAEAESLERLDSKVAAKLKPLETARSQIEDVVFELRGLGAGIDSDPQELLQLEERLTKVQKVQKKYGNTYEEITKCLKGLKTQIHDLENSEQHIRKLEREENRLTEELESMAKDLHTRRQNGAELLSKSVNDELKDLNMRGLLFHVQVETSEALNPQGQTSLEFMTQNSRNDECRPLAKFASGGELSRILLALKQVVGESDAPRTYLFDEVDAGISGRTAEKVGRKLKTISKGQQVICVTHLPQVAAHGDVHFWISKKETPRGMQMEVMEISDDDRVYEIARLISGEKITETSLAHARELLNSVPR